MQLKVIRPLLFLLCLLGVQKAEGQVLEQVAEYGFLNQSFLPAKAGEQGWQRFYLLRRDQWVGFPGGPQSIHLGWSGNFSGIQGMGLAFAQDQLGIQRKYSLQGSKSFDLGDVSGFKIMGGLSAGLRWVNLQSNIDGNLDPLVSSFSRDKIVLLSIGFSALSDWLSYHMGFHPVKPSLDGSHWEGGLIQVVDVSPRMLKRRNLEFRLLNKWDLFRREQFVLEGLISKQMNDFSLGFRMRSTGTMGMRLGYLNTSWFNGPLEMIFNIEYKHLGVVPSVFSNEIGVAYRFSKLSVTQREGHKTVRYL